MKEELKEVLQEELKQEDLSMNSVEYSELIGKVKRFLFGFMIGGEYSDERFTEEVEKLSGTDLRVYTDYPDKDLYELIELSVSGYSGFGVDFIEKVINEDPDLAIKLFEVTVQQLIDLNYAVNEYQNDLEAHLSELKKDHNDSEKGE